jgi:hypothetical protein
VQLHSFKATCHWFKYVIGVNFSKVLLSTCDFKLVGIVNFNKVNVFSYPMLIERMTLVNHFKI